MKKAKLLWMDLEMTGLDPLEDSILEVAMIMTDFQLKELVRYKGVVKVSEKLIEKRMVGEFWEKNQEVRKALIKQNKKGKNREEIEREILELMDKYQGEEIYLAGNSIHQDRKFIDLELKELAKRLHYRMLDVSAWKVYFENALGKKMIKKEQHRAMDDIVGSIEELRYYLEFLKK